MAVAILIALGLLVLVDLVVFSYDKYGWSLIVMAVTIALAYFFTPYVKDFIEAHGIQKILFIYLPGYLGVGVLVALVKWALFVRKKVKEIKVSRINFNGASESVVREHLALANDQSSVKTDTTQSSDKPLSAEQRLKAFYQFFKRNQGYGSYWRSLPSASTLNFTSPDAVIQTLAPEATKHADDIFYWVIQWPVAVISMIFADFFQSLVNWVIELCDATFSAIGRKMVSNQIKDL